MQESRQGVQAFSNAVTTAMSKVVTQAKQRFLLSNQKNETQPLEDRKRWRQMESESEGERLS